MSFLSRFHRTYNHYKWRKAVKKRCNYKCDITGDTKKLECHHLYDAKNHPLLRSLVTNGVLLSSKLHKEFHLKYMGGYKNSCTKDDYINFKKTKR